MPIHSLNIEEDINLEYGGVLQNPTITYHTRGSLNKDRSNVVWVCHALTANSDFETWWSGLFIENGFFAEGDWFVICANVLGSCYGSTGPQSINPASGEAYLYGFPQLTIRDLVSGHQILARKLGIDRIACLIGGSLGGQQALVWACLEPSRFDFLVPIATNAVHSPWGIAFNESQRLAIQLDPSWGEQNIKAGESGMKVARGIALLSYRNYNAYQLSQPRLSTDPFWEYKAKTYQRYQGEKLAQRFNAQNYMVLSNAMDSHDLSKLNLDGDSKTALSAITAQTLVISMAGDMLFPSEEQTFIAEGIPNATHYSVDTKWGHDGFLLEGQAITEALQLLFTNKLNQGNNFLSKYNETKNRNYWPWPCG